MENLDYVNRVIAQFLPARRSHSFYGAPNDVNLDIVSVPFTFPFMKLSLRGEYALRALLVLGLHYNEPVVRIQTISQQQNIPKRFLEQILNDLKSAGLVQSKRGVSGGYRLARKPEEITLAAVVRHIEGALAPVSCVSERYYEKCSCPDESRCAIRSGMKEIRDAVVKIAERVTIAELCERYERLQTHPTVALDYVI